MGSHTPRQDDSKKETATVGNMPVGFLFARKGSITVNAATTTADPVDVEPSLWRDGMGRAATRSIQVLAVLIFVSVVVFGMSYLSTLIIPILLALIFASALRPLLDKLEGFGMKPIWATILTLLGAVVVLGGVVTMIVNAVRHQWQDLADSAREGFFELQGLIENLPFEITEEQFTSVQESVRGFLMSSKFGSSAIAGVSATASFVTGFVLLVVVLFFFMKDGPKIWEFVLRPFEGEQYARGRRVGARTVKTLGQYVRGTAMVAAVDAIGIGVGLAIIGVPLALPLAVLVFALSFIPLVGATVAGILAALVALVANGLWAAVIVVIIVIGVNQLEGNLLQPKIMGTSLSLHPLVILLALTAGTIIGGILGAVLSVPVAAVGWGVLQVWDGPNTPAKFVRPKVRERLT